MRIEIVGALIALSCTTLIGCSTQISGTHPAPVRTSATAERVLTAERLRYALAPVPDGYEQILPPKAGSYDRIFGSLQDSSSGSLRCLRYLAPAPALSSASEDIHNAAAAYVVLARGHFSGAGNENSNMLGEALVAIRGAAGDRLDLSIPASCRQFTRTIAHGIIQYRLITSESIHVGSAAGKIIGYEYSDSKRAGQQWLLLFQTSGYLGEVSGSGPAVRRRAVVAFARKAYAYAERTLR